MKAFVITILALCSGIFGWANTFTVTSNADSGPGTLRDAIQQAAANGTTVSDLVIFAISDTTRIGRTINLLSPLPQLTSFLTIDGTTQTGAPFGISNARVEITGAITFEIYSATDIAIYGLYLYGQGIPIYALHFRQARNIQFGAAGKGNIVNGFGQAIYSDYIYATDSSSSNISIQGNLMGIDESGDFSNYNLFNNTSFYLRNVKNLTIGGLGVGEGNIICDLNYSMDITCTRDEDYGYFLFDGNKLGTDRTGMIRLVPPQNQGYYINGYNDGNGSVTGTTTWILEMIDNISAVSFSLFDLKSYFKIMGNRFGVGADNITPIYGTSSYILFFEFCGQGTIGGPAATDINYFSNCTGTAVRLFWTNNITITKNSFFCNGVGIEDYNWMVNRPKPFVTINTISTGSVGGTSLPSSIIELFYDDACPGCEGKTYIGSTTADASGNWIYITPLTGAIVATATDTYGATSPFSSATINTTNVVVQDATCGKNNGSIKRIQIISGTEWHWEDDHGNIVGTNVDLNNVGPGNYKFVTSIGGNACTTQSNIYTIKNIDKPVINVGDISVTQPTCGLKNGELKYDSSFISSWTYQWLDGTGTVVNNDFSHNNPYSGLPPNKYTLRVALTQDSGCYSQYGPFTLVNQSGPSLNTSNVYVVNSTCGGSNGGIHNLNYQNATGTVYVAWQNENGDIVADSLDLNNVKAGKYRMKFKDGSGCDTINTEYYTILDDGSISIDQQHAIIDSPSCRGNDGSINGITATNATAFLWTNSATGYTVGNNLNVGALAPGTYQLIATNSYGCVAKSIPINVVQHNFQNLTVLGAAVRNANCNLNNGYIHIYQFSADSLQYTFEWIDSMTHVILSNTASADNIAPGLYVLNAIDKNGCSQRIYTASIGQDGIPLQPELADQYIPRNTSTTITINNPQIGTYDLFDTNLPGAQLLDTSSIGSLKTPIIMADRSFFVSLDQNGCRSPLSKVNIKVFDSTRIFVPNAFTPNNDGVNDKWHIRIQGIMKNFKVTVFNRWGGQVYASNDPGFYWDGSLAGQMLSGVYVYLIIGKDYYNHDIQLSGTVTIVR